QFVERFSTRSQGGARRVGRPGRRPTNQVSETAVLHGAHRWPLGYAESVKAIVIGCGRVGSTVALELRAEGWDVVAIDEKEEALGRLAEGRGGGSVVGHGMDTSVLRRAGIEDAAAVVIATDGDNTNIVVGQVVQ